MHASQRSFKPRGFSDMSRRFLLTFVCAAVLVGCGPIDTLTEGFTHSKAVSTELEKSLGVKPSVGFSWTNGSLTSVTITFEGIPANATLTEIAEKSKQVVAAEFKQAPNKLVIAFAIEP